MSISSLTDLAIQRDVAQPKTQPTGGSGGAAGGSVPVQFVGALTSAIPTEPLAAYTAVVGVVAGLKSGGGYLPFRWVAFGLFLGITAVAVVVLYNTKADGGNQPLSEVNKRRLPVVELMAALVAAAAWGLAMPGSALSIAMRGNGATIATAGIVVGGAAVLSLLTPWLTHASPTQGQDAAGSPIPKRLPAPVLNVPPVVSTDAVGPPDTADAGSVSAGPGGVAAPASASGPAASAWTMSSPGAGGPGSPASSSAVTSALSAPGTGEGPAAATSSSATPDVPPAAPTSATPTVPLPMASAAADPPGGAGGGTVGDEHNGDAGPGSGPV